MLRNMKSLMGYTILATDGEKGIVDDLVFDDVSWSMAYLVANVGESHSKRVLLPPTAVGRPDSEHRRLPVAYSLKQIAACPGADMDQMISRRRDRNRHAASHVSTDQPGEVDPHLLSVQEVIHSSVRSIDGKIGTLADLVAEDTTWKIRFMIIDSGEHPGEHTRLISPQDVQRVAWMDQIVYMDITNRDDTTGLNMPEGNQVHQLT